MVDGKPWMQVRYMRHPHSLTPLIPLFFCQSAWWAIKAYSEFRYYCLLSFVFSSVRNELGLWRQTGLVSNPGFAVSRGGLWGWNNLWASASSSVKWALTYRSCPQTFLWHWKLKLLVTQLLQTLCNPMDCSPPRLLCPRNSPGKNTGVDCHSLLPGGGWGEYSWTRDQTWVFCIADRFFTIWATWKVP